MNLKSIQDMQLRTTLALAREAKPCTNITLLVNDDKMVRDNAATGLKSEAVDLLRGGGFDGMAERFLLACTDISSPYAIIVVAANYVHLQIGEGERVFKGKHFGGFPLVDIRYDEDGCALYEYDGIMFDSVKEVTIEAGLDFAAEPIFRSILEDGRVSLHVRDRDFYSIGKAVEYAKFLSEEPVE